MNKINSVQSMQPPGLDSCAAESGVTVYGINLTSGAFEPIFHVSSQMEAETIVKSLCTACEISDCPPMKRKLNACFSLINHNRS